MTNDLVAGEDVFVAATGVTTGSLLRGVRYLPNGAVTDSIVMRSRSGTSRRIEATHLLDKLEALTGRAVPLVLLGRAPPPAPCPASICPSVRALFIFARW